MVAVKKDGLWTVSYKGKVTQSTCIKHAARALLVP
jgi:hypothetical protein